VCGITGWVDWRRDLTEQRPTMESMTSTLACRGPDGQGVWTSPRAAIGHRRLAVIDVEGGTQPMTAAQQEADRPCVLTFSGEIYNFRELRSELTGRGHRFRTRSDTEVLLRAYLEWGEDCVERLNGMFAFAVWDGARGRLLLARDRMGIKPLYYLAYPGGLLFGSEPKALLANPMVPPEVDASGLAELFANFGGHTPGHAVYANMRELRPGRMLLAGDAGVQESAYWELRPHPHEDDPAQTRRRVRELLADSVQRQLVADVPLCALVSGGVDSSALAALATRALGDGSALRTFAVDFPGSAADFTPDSARPDRDAPHVGALVEHLGSRHTDVVVDTPDLLAAQDAATRARDLPCLGDLDGSLYLLFQAIQGRSTVALSGESADEVFGGYPWFHDPEAVARDGFPWSPHPLGLANVLSREVRDWVRPGDYLETRYREALAEVPHLSRDTGHERRMREISYLALTRYLPMLLARKDRTSMAAGLEVRVPFCDHRLVEYVWNAPWAVKAADGERKALLRDAVRDLLPADLASRPKSMFPAATDPAYDKTVAERVRGLLGQTRGLGPLLDAERVRALLEGRTAQPSWMRRLALAYLLQVDTWMTDYRIRIDGTR
jgi:asparagine synthase (glutamine-hydrolysing)